MSTSNSLNSLSFEVSARPQTQLELGPTRERERDRNFHLGGRSFYFFDFDDNVAFLATPIFLFHKNTQAEIQISSQEWAMNHTVIGKSGPYAQYEIKWDERTGSFRAFRDHDTEELHRLGLKSQIFIQDIAAALGQPDFQWQGPSWNCFYHATFNQRPVSLITARGHSAETLKSGVQLFVKTGFLPSEPSYLSLYPVSNHETRLSLGDTELKCSVAELKQKAIRASVEKAIEVYGPSNHHRFGMSDDDPKNIQLIFEEMCRLKSDYPEMSFFLIETHLNQFIKHEVTSNSLTEGVRLNFPHEGQLSFPWSTTLK